jgi:RNA polymerase sigma factor (TIGR02999 family)
MSEMPDDTPRTVTRLLREWSAGDEAALESLMPLVYRELRRLAAASWRRERVGHTLQPTAIVHEAFLRLVAQQGVAWEGRTQFLAIAAQMMRRVLTDHARRKGAAKRGGAELVRVELDDEVGRLEARQLDLVALDEALAKLESLDSRQARVVELRYFAGLTIAETAEALELSPATVKREWETAKAWLVREMDFGAEA